MTQLEKINYRYQQLEFRTVNNHLIQDGILTKAEIVEWSTDDSYCWVVGYWEYDGVSWCLTFVSNRFLSVDKDHLFELMEFGQKYLDRCEELQ